LFVKQVLRASDDLKTNEQWSFLWNELAPRSKEDAKSSRVHRTVWKETAAIATIAKVVGLAKLSISTADVQLAMCKLLTNQYQWGFEFPGRFILRHASFINQDCARPNCVLRPQTTNLEGPSMAIVAAQDIAKGAELTQFYGFDEDSDFECRCSACERSEK
jgi:hypothetical protein